MKSNPQGRYLFQTVIPGNYPAFPGSPRLRPKHIHFIAHKRGYEPLITQCFFAGDDHWLALDGDVKPSLIIAPQEMVVASDQKTQKGTFDIVLNKEHHADARAKKFYEEYVGEYQMTRNRIAIVTARQGKLFLKILNAPYDLPA